MTMKVYVEYRMDKCTRIECPHFNPGSCRQ